MDSDFLKIMPLVFRDEGGWSEDPEDAGNWTSGAPGAGELKGTNFGISAASYPNLNIKALTQTQALGIYYSDWWMKYNFNLLTSPFNMKSFDIGINMGAKMSIKLLQQACKDLGYTIFADGVIGPDTEAAVAHADEEFLWAQYVMRIENHYRSIEKAEPRDQKYLAGWLRRAAELTP